MSLLSQEDVQAFGECDSARDGARSDPEYDEGCERKRKGQNQVLVRWEGWSSKFDSWIP